jgi:hypothetical protein
VGVAFSLAPSAGLVPVTCTVVEGNSGDGAGKQPANKSNASRSSSTVPTWDLEQMYFGKILRIPDFMMCSDDCKIFLPQSRETRQG